MTAPGRGAATDRPRRSCRTTAPGRGAATDAPSWSCRRGEFSAGAGRAGAEDLQGVADLGVPVLGGDPVRPALHRRPGHLHGPAAGPADQVVVMALAAPAIEVLAAGRAHHVDLPGVG